MEDRRPQLPPPVGVELSDDGGPPDLDGGVLAPDSGVLDAAVDSRALTGVAECKE